MSDNQMMKRCSKCGADKHVSSFYRKHDVCRSCVKSAFNETRLPLEAQAEQRRQERMLREELRKIAQKRIDSRKKTRLARKRAALEEPVLENATIAPDPVMQELARRELAKRKLIEFVKMFHPRYKAGWVHHDICRRLEKFSRDVAEEKSPRLMILMPPRHGKSQIASKLFPAWHLGHNPHHEFIAASYNISLALEFSREVRGVVRSNVYGKLFPDTKLDTEISAAEAWKLISPTGTAAGGYVAAGSKVGITGKGAHVLVIDDPVKDQEEADSLDIRTKVWNWYLTSAYTRLAPGGGILIIQTCWHDDDLSGRIQQLMKDNPEDEDIDHFEVVKYPAIAEEDEEFRAKGEPLHPERYSYQRLMRIQRQMGGPMSRAWCALYQQNPVPQEGAYFTKDMIQYRDENIDLEHLDIYQAWDFAISAEQIKGGNWTVGVTAGLDYNDTVHIIERRRFKTNDSAKIEDEIIDMYGKYRRVTGVGFEDGQIFRAMKPSLKRRSIEKQVHIPLDDKSTVLRPIKEKEVRARPLQARLQNHKVTFPRGQEWVDEMWREFLRFPAGVQDDQVDAMAWVIQLLLGKSPPAAPKPPRRKTEKTVAEQLAKHVGGSTSGGHMAA